MRITVRLFATLTRLIKDTKAGAPFDVDVVDGSTLNDLVRFLKLPADQVKVIFINGRAQELSYILKADDEVGIFPPIGGG